MGTLCRFTFKVVLNHPLLCIIDFVVQIYVQRWTLPFHVSQRFHLAQAGNFVIFRIILILILAVTDFFKPYRLHFI